METRSNIPIIKFGDTIQYVVKNGSGYDCIYEFKIAGIVDDFEPYMDSSEYDIKVLLSELLIEEENQEFEKMSMDSWKNFDINIDTDKPDELKERVSQLNSLREQQGKQQLFESDLYSEKSKGEMKEISQRLLVKIPIYTFVGLITLFSILNIFNTISNSIILRKREIAELKSLGMSELQVNKMLFFEGIFYGLDGILYGIVISIFILYVMYLAMLDTKKYAFILPWQNIVASIVVTYSIIFIAIQKAKSKMKGKNIIDEIKQENI